MTAKFSQFQRDAILYTSKEFHTISCYIGLFSRKYGLLFTSDLLPIIAQYFAKSYNLCVFKPPQQLKHKENLCLFHNNVHLNTIENWNCEYFDIYDKNKNFIDTKKCQTYCIRLYFNNKYNYQWCYLAVSADKSNNSACYFGIYIYPKYIGAEAKKWRIADNEKAKFLIEKDINQFDMFLDFNNNQLKYKLIDDNENREYIFEKPLKNTENNIINNSTKWYLYGTVYTRFELQIANINPKLYGKYKDLVDWPAKYLD